MKQLYIADDDRDFADYVADVAQLEGWNVKTCENGLRLLEAMMINVGPAWLLVDVNMPDMDGIEVIKALAKLDGPLQLHFMTGGPRSTLDAAETIARGHGLAVGGNFLKPITKRALASFLMYEAVHLER